MARPSEDFLLAWSSLSGDSKESGWQAISMASAGTVKIQAGKRSPDDTEAILVCFSTAKLTAIEKLPYGQGFQVERIDLDSGELQLALTRRIAGNIEMFSNMACDVIGALDDAVVTGVAETGLLRVFLKRLVAWQKFMAKGPLPLNPEEELGLVGELVIMARLIEAGLSCEIALDSWIGPDDAAQDFVLGGGAIEVKATLSTAGFPVKISSLEQLDDASISPLFLNAIRFSIEPKGDTLPILVSKAEQMLKDDFSSIAMLHNKLLAAGYHTSHALTYTRPFEVKELRTYAVAFGFPRLTTGTVPKGISRTIYEVNLEHATDFLIEFSTALRELGVTQ